MNESAHLWLIPLFPFLGFLLNGILGSRHAPAARLGHWRPRASRIPRPGPE